MKKKILSLLLIIALMAGMLVGLTACGDSDKDDEKESGPEEVIKEYFADLTKGKFKQAFELIDWEMYLMLDEGYDYDELEDKDNYEEFVDEYGNYIEKIDDQIDDLIDSYKEAYEDAKTFKLEVKDTEKAEKVEGTKNIYSVDVEIKTTIKDEDDEGENFTEDYTIYVMKKNGKYYIIGGIDEIMTHIASALY